MTSGDGEPDQTVTRWRGRPRHRSVTLDPCDDSVRRLGVASLEGEDDQQQRRTDTSPPSATGTRYRYRYRYRYKYRWRSSSRRSSQSCGGTGATAPMSSMEAAGLERPGFFDQEFRSSVVLPRRASPEAAPTPRAQPGTGVRRAAPRTGRQRARHRRGARSRPGQRTGGARRDMADPPTAPVRAHVAARGGRGRDARLSRGPHEPVRPSGMSRAGHQLSDPRHQPSTGRSVPVQPRRRGRRSACPSPRGRPRHQHLPPGDRDPPPASPQRPRRHGPDCGAAGHGASARALGGLVPLIADLLVAGVALHRRPDTILAQLVGWWRGAPRDTSPAAVPAEEPVRSSAGHVAAGERSARASLHGSGGGTSRRHVHGCPVGHNVQDLDKGRRAVEKRIELSKQLSAQRFARVWISTRGRTAARRPSRRWPGRRKGWQRT